MFSFARRLRLLTGAAALSLIVAAPAFAAQVRGVVVDDATGSVLPGAKVSIDGVSAVADANGNFTLDGVAAGARTLRVEYLGYAAADVPVTVAEPAAADVRVSLTAGAVDEVLIVGQRLSDRKALQTKKVATNTIDALYANDVGKLPDQNVAEAVRRLPGVSVANDQGEGRYVVIRGVNPDLANVTLDGQTVGAPEPEGRQVKLDDIPSSMIASVQVIKSLTPDLDANAIAGAVNIDTLTAFDRKAPFAYGRVSVGQNDLGDNPVSSYDLTGGLRFGADEQFGLVLSAGSSRRAIESQNVQGSANWATVNGFKVPDDFRLRDYQLVRERSGYVANFDWRPSDTLKLHARFSHAHYVDNEFRDQFRLEIPVTTPQFLSNQTATSGDFSRSRGTRLLRNRAEVEQITSGNVGGTWRSTIGRFDFDLTYIASTKDDPRRNEWEFRSSSSAFPLSYDLSSDLIRVTPAASAYDATKFPIRRVRYVTRAAQEDLVQARIDWETKPEFLNGGSFKLGAKVLDRSKTNDQSSAYYNGTGFTLADVARSPLKSIYDGRYPFGPRVGWYTAQTYRLNNPGKFTYDTTASLNDSLTSDYDVQERVLAAYAMATWKVGRLTVVPGVRVESTDGTYKGKLVKAGSTLNQPFNSTKDVSYTDWFPGVNARFDVTDNLVIRAAVTTSIGRPNYENLVPTIFIDGSNVTLGNPDLSPLKSTNFDASVEYYLPWQGILSAGVFYKDISDPIYTQVSTVTNTTIGGQFFASATVTKPRNADSATVKGVEFNLQSQFGFLPAPFDGFGASLGAAFIDSEAKGIFGRTGSAPLFLQSDRVVSAQLFYEKYGVAGRLAYSYRSKYLDEVGANPSKDIYVDDFGQIDARLSYAFRNRLSVFVEGANLNDEPWHRYVGKPNQLVENEKYGWSARLGVEFKY